ncbi:MAG: hypothetical protein OXC65_16210 [Thiotrichales bacterium]|nr:hypothetical protein [Thiotrichales bacterium]
MSRLSQETLAIIGTTIAVAALILTTLTGVLDEARADRQVFQEQILRLTEQQGVLGGQIEIIRDQLAAGG